MQRKKEARPPVCLATADLAPFEGERERLFPAGHGFESNQRTRGMGCSRDAISAEWGQSTRFQPAVG